MSAPSLTVGEQFDEHLLWTPTEKDLLVMHRRGLYRYGVVAAILDEDQNLLMEQHYGSAKTTEGMWGPLAETTLVNRQADGSWVVEPTVATVLRGLEQETGVTVNPANLRMPLSGQPFETTWPVGVTFGRQEGAALCPIVMIPNQVRDKIMQAGPTDEIMATDFMSIEVAQEMPFVRPGTVNWLAKLSQTMIDISFVDAVQPTPETWFDGNDPSNQDAILAQMFSNPLEQIV